MNWWSACWEKGTNLSEFPWNKLDENWTIPKESWVSHCFSLARQLHVHIPSGERASHAFSTRLLLFYFAYGAQNSGQPEGTSVKVLFLGLPKICSLSGTPRLNSKSRKGQCVTYLSASLKGTYPFPIRGTLLPGH